MSEQDRPLKDRVWEFTKDFSIKISRKAEKYWRINTLRVEIASIKHRINVKYKELGRFVYDAMKAERVAEASYQVSSRELFDEIHRLGEEIADREQQILILEREMSEESSQVETDQDDPPAEAPPTVPQNDDKPEQADEEAETSPGKEPK